MIYEKHMTEEVPRILEECRLTINNSDRAILSECTELRTSSRTSLEPNHQRYFWVRLVKVWTHCTEKFIVHSTIISIPVDALISWIKMDLPEKAWKCISLAYRLSCCLQNSVVLVAARACNVIKAAMSKDKGFIDI